MPNHVMSIMRMNGIPKLPLFIKNQYGGLEFDFNKLIPMPESLNLLTHEIYLLLTSAEACSVQPPADFVVQASFIAYSSPALFQ